MNVYEGNFEQTDEVDASILEKRGVVRISSVQYLAGCFNRQDLQHDTLAGFFQSIRSCQARRQPQQAKEYAARLRSCKSLTETISDLEQLHGCLTGDVYL